MSYQTEKIQEYNELYGENTSDSSEYNISSSNKLKDNNINEITKANLNGISVLDYINIMGLFIGGTYYTIDIIDKKKNSNEA